MAAKQVYTYACVQHPLGEFVRDVERFEWDTLVGVGETLARHHFANCWVKGCQMPLTQVRLVTAATSDPNSVKERER